MIFAPQIPAERLGKCHERTQGCRAARQWASMQNDDISQQKACRDGVCREIDEVYLTSPRVVVPMRIPAGCWVEAAPRRSPRPLLQSVAMRWLKVLSLVVVCALVAPREGRLFADERATELPPAATRKVDFAGDVLPLLKKNCFSCHGPEHQEGGLRLDIKKRAFDGGDSGVEFVAGKSTESRLVRVIAGVDEDFGLMPPKGKGTPLSAGEISVVRAWIDQGAVWPDDQQLASAAADHWSLKAVHRPPLPVARDVSWQKEPVDAFVLPRLEME